MTKPTVLVVDDDDDVVEILTLILTNAGYRIVAAANGRAALQHLQEGPRPSVILLDFMMPVMNAWEFQAQFAQDPDLRSIPIVAISGDGSVERKAKQIEAAAWLRKPFALDDLLETVRRFAPRPRRDRAR